MIRTDNDFGKLLEESVKTHGHLCPGQVLGVRMSLLLRLKEVQDRILPVGSDFVERSFTA